MQSRRHRDRFAIRLQHDAAADKRGLVAFAADLDAVADIRGQAVGQGKAEAAMPVAEAGLGKVGTNLA